MKFKDLVKHIHPDTNPGITNAGDKMRECILYRNNPKKLSQLAITWGIIIDETPKQNFNSWNTNTNKYRTLSYIIPNTMYCNSMEGYHTKENKWYLIVKTVELSVFYWDDIGSICACPFYIMEKCRLRVI